MCVILPFRFQVTQRNMQQNYQDKISVVQKYVKYNLLITFTCNYFWPKIVTNLPDEVMGLNG